MARPTKYRKEMIPTLLELMSEGASLLEVQVALDISDDTLIDWCNPQSPRYHPEFSDAKKRGIKLSEAWWQRQGRVALREKDFQYVGWYMNMKNRFGWRDKHEEVDKPPMNPVVFLNEVPSPKQPNSGELLPDDTSNSRPATD